MNAPKDMIKEMGILEWTVSLLREQNELLTEIRDLLKTGTPERPESVTETEPAETRVETPAEPPEDWREKVILLARRKRSDGVEREVILKALESAGVDSLAGIDEDKARELHGLIDQLQPEKKS